MLLLFKLCIVTALIKTCESLCARETDRANVRASARKERAAAAALDLEAVRGQEAEARAAADELFEADKAAVDARYAHIS